MSDYLDKQGKVIKFEEINKESERTGVPLERIVELFELVEVGDPGKGLGTTVEDANVAPQINTPVNTESASENISSVSPEPRKRGFPGVQKAKEKISEFFEKPEETQEKSTLIERTFGKNIITDFYGDIYRAGEEGFAQSELVDPTFEVLKKGSKATDEDVMSFIEANKDLAEENMQSDEMRDFQKIYNEEGKGIFGVVKGLVKNPTVLTSVIVSSVASMAGSVLKSEEALATAASTAAVGAGVGLAGLGVGAVPGAISGFMGGAMTAMESSLTFGQLIQEDLEANNKDFSLNNVKEILNDPEKYNDLATKAVGRGVAIGTVEALSAGLAGKTVKAVGKLGKGVRTATAAGAAVEMAGGSLGEVAGMAAAGQEFDTAEIALEGVAGLGSAPITVGLEVIKIPKLKAKSEVNKIVADSPSANINELFDKAMADPVTAAQFDIVKVKNSESIVKENLRSEIAKGNITKEQASQSLAKFKQTESAVRTVEKTGLDLTQEQGVEVVNLLAEKNNLKNKIEGVDEALASVQKERIKEIDESIKSIAKDASEVKLKAETEVVEKLAGKENVKTFDTVEEFVEATGKPAEADAFIDADGIIFINKQRAAEVGGFPAPTHEYLHLILKSTFSDKTASTNLVKDFNKVLEKEGFLDVVQKRIDDNYRFNKDGSEKAFDEYAEEYLTAFSDAIAKKRY